MYVCTIYLESIFVGSMYIALRLTTQHACNNNPQRKKDLSTWELGVWEGFERETLERVGERKEGGRIVMQFYLNKKIYWNDI